MYNRIHWQLKDGFDKSIRIDIVWDDEGPYKTGGDFWDDMDLDDLWARIGDL